MPQTVPAYVARERVTHLEVRPHLDRYLKQNNRPLSDFDLGIESVYIPYWQVEGLLLKLRQQTDKRVQVEQYGYAQEETVIEQQHSRVNLAPHSNSVCSLSQAEYAPASLGMRTGNLTLRPLVEENINNDFKLLTPQISTEAAVERVEKQVQNLNRIAGIGNRRSVSKFFGSGMELIQMPYFICTSRDDNGSISYLLDAITGRVETEFRDRAWLDSAVAAASDVQYGSLSLSLHRCGNCGEDLPDSPALLVICKNCGARTTLDGAIDPNITLRAARIEQGSADTFLPFWVFELSDAERARLKHVFGALQNVSDAVVPAFEISNSEAMHRAIVRATLSYSNFTFSEIDALESSYMPVVERIAASRSQLRASYLRAQLERTNHLVESDALNGGQLRAVVYIPFRIENYFLVDCQMGAVTIEKVAVLGRTGSLPG